MFGFSLTSGEIISIKRENISHASLTRWEEKGQKLVLHLTTGNIPMVINWEEVSNQARVLEFLLGL